MATFVPVCSVCETEVTKSFTIEGDIYWLHLNGGLNCSGPYYPKLLKPTLNDVMEFEHVIRVNDSGNVQTVPLLNPYFGLTVVLADSGEWEDEFYLPEGWELLRGFTGQFGYNGPVMHASEFIGGGLETHILETPGFYVALTVESYCYFDGETNCPEETGCNCEPAGWAVAYKPFTESEGATNVE